MMRSLHSGMHSGRQAGRLLFLEGFLSGQVRSAWGRELACPDYGVELHAAASKAICCSLTVGYCHTIVRARGLIKNFDKCIRDA